MNDLLIVNASLVNEGKIIETDILIRDGRIEALGSLSGTSASDVLDAEGRFVIPGMIDDQVHFREPGLTHKGDIQTESRAAVAGGITSFMEMPNVNPLTITSGALEDKYQRASKKSLANYAFYLGASNDNIEDIKFLDPATACGVKVFMGASTGDMLVDDPRILEDIFKFSPCVIATHCEDTPTILKNEEIFRKEYGEDVPFAKHPLIRSEEACYLSSSMAVDLAKKFDADLHVLHLTTARELELFQAGDIEDKKITAEVCVHHLYFNESDYEEKGALIKCNPAVKTAEDQQALLKAMQEGRIDVLATDHAPHTWEEKQRSYFKAPSGLPLVQQCLQAVLEFYHRGELSLEDIVKLSSHNVARRFQVKERGFVREGYWADLVILDIDQPQSITKDMILYKCGWTPFEGTRFKSSIHTTIVNGNIVYADGQIQSDALGCRLEFTRKN